MADFETRDPNTPDFWSERFRREFTPWDQQGVPRMVQDFAGRQQVPLRTLIPGCGTGYEVAFLSEAGWPVTAIDFAPEAVERAQRTLGRWADRVRQADFFTYQPEPPPQLVYERAFLCALPPARRVAVAARWAELLGTGGLLAGFFFFGETPKGPPFGILPAELDALLEPAFERIEDLPVGDSIPVFAGRERWQVWRRR